MEVKIDNEAQVCRLCGQFESIYIDVFGDEGSKRLLGLKIQSKINILIKKDDGLPHTICIRCVGTLEFLVDFYKNCQETQKLFQGKKKITNVNLETLEIEKNSDKENDSSTVSVLKNKSKNLLKSLNNNVLSEISSEKITSNLEAYQPLFLNSKLYKNNKSSSNKNQEILSKNNENDNNIFEKIIKIKQELNNDENYSTNSNVINEKPIDTIESENLNIKNELKTNTSSSLIDINNKENNKIKNIDDKTVNYYENLNISKVRKNSLYGKISDLISKEDKEKIEEYYNIDMSAVDEKKVLERIEIIDRKKFICKICDTIYPRMDKCQVHIWGHFDMKPYKCNKCNFNTLTVTNIRSHIRKCHLKIKPFNCLFCNKKYATSVLLDEHLNTHTGVKPFKCNYCNYKSSSRQVLNYHNETHKKTKDITCDICKRKFYSKGRLRVHILTHNKDKNLICKYCSQHFTTIEAVNKHYDSVHSHDYTCLYCEKKSKSKKALNNHLKVHFDAQYKCHLCTNVYKSSHILKEHILKHQGIRKYKCDVCDKSFAQQSHLAAHKAVHSDKRFICPGCEKAFNRQDNMKSHAKKCELFLSNPDLKNIFNRSKSSKLNIVNNNINYSTFSSLNQNNFINDNQAIDKIQNEKLTFSSDKAVISESVISIKAF